MKQINNYIIEKLKINKNISNGLLGDIIEIISPKGIIINDEIKDIIIKWLDGYDNTINLFYNSSSKFNPNNFSVSDSIKFKPMKHKDWVDCIDFISDDDKVYEKDDKVIWKFSVDLVFSAAFTEADDYGIYFEKAIL